MEVSIHSCSFGQVLIGSTDNILLSIELGKDIDECYRNFINRWEKVDKQIQLRTNNRIVNQVLQVIETGIYDPNIEFILTGTVFQQQVWKVISKIEFGKTLSYKDIAIKINNPNAVRAIGTACGSNPIAIIVPCHRVVKIDGSDGGYRWGTNIKQKLLQREQ